MLQGASAKYRLYRQCLFDESCYGSLSVKADRKNSGKDCHISGNFNGKSDGGIGILYGFVHFGGSLPGKSIDRDAAGGNADDKDHLSHQRLRGAFPDHGVSLLLFLCAGRVHNFSERKAAVFKTV